MQERHLFEYAVLRVVPRAEREEFINVGVILYCPSKGFLQVRFVIDEKRLSALDSQLDIDALRCYLEAIAKVCTGKKEGGAIGQLPIASRFRWLTATRSTVVQASKVHPGLCDEPQGKLATLFNQLVL